jgi:hypothetical protein
MRSVSETLRDARYVVPFTVLVGVVVVSAALAEAQPAQTSPGLGASAPAAATNVPEPTQSPADARRAADLATLRDLLEQYRADHGAYPTTEHYTVTLCATAWDAGCLLTTLSSRVPASDGTHPYWWRSDGSSYTIFAFVDAPPAQDDCPTELPKALAGGPVLCVNSPGGIR